jgi:hypothetical protein
MRTGTLSPCNESRIALAQWIARAGPSNVARKAVAQGLQLPSTEARKLPAHRRIMSIEKVAPGSIAIGAGAPGYSSISASILSPASASVAKGLSL